MLKNYLLVALRTLRRQKGYTALIVAGLALGVACCVLIGLYVQEELGFDRFHADADRIYRISQTTPDGGEAQTGPGFALYLAEDVPDIEAVARVVPAGAIIAAPEAGPDRRFQEDGVVFVDPAFLDLFSFPLLLGDAATALAEPGSVLLTESTARRYFGEANPIGQTLTLDNRADLPLRVTGVLADPPADSHLQFSLVSNWATLALRFGIPEQINSFWWPRGFTYVRLREGTEAAAFDEALRAFAERRREPEVAAEYVPHAEPLTEIRLKAAYEGHGGTLPSVQIFGLIALAVLVLACVNFMNLATARSAQRAREVGVRKSLGARRWQVALQFLGESFMLSLIALALGVGLAQGALPWFNELAGRELTMGYGSNGSLWVGLVALVGVTGLLAGAYPALVLSRFRPVTVLKGAVEGGAGGAGLRKALVVFQFAVSVALIAGTLIAARQLQFLRDANLGFDVAQTVVLPGEGLAGSEPGAPARYAALREELARLPEVAGVTAASAPPGLGTGLGGYIYEAEGHTDPGGEARMNLDLVDGGYFEQLGLTIVAGRAPTHRFPGDLGRAETVPYGQLTTTRYLDRSFVINATAARRLGWTFEEALGKTVRFYIRENDVVYQDYRGTVVGVVEDAHVASLREPISAQAYQLAATPDGGYLGLGSVLVQTRPGDARAALAALERVWEDVVPDRPFLPTYLDAEIDALYRTEVRQGRIVGTFAALAVVIACLGLFGLAAYAAERRRKEIGVRKVLGASVTSLVLLQARDFLALVAVAAVLATPIAWWAMGRWLERFAYRVEVGPWLFVGAGVAALLLALLTVSAQSIRAATADPVKALRYE